MQYHQSIIYAHRPWISKSHHGLQPQPPKGPGYTHAREMCIQSAIAISKILYMYETRYTLRRINVQAVSITSSVILFLLFATLLNIPYSNSQSDIAFYLTTCFRALDEFAICWKSAHRARDLLVGLRRQWDLRTRSKQPRRDDEVVYVPQKRSKTSSGPHGVAPVSHDEALQIEFDLDFMLGTEAEVSGRL